MALEVKENKLIIYDIIGGKIPEYSDIIPYLLQFEVEEHEFRFHTDKLNIENVRRVGQNGDNLFVLDTGGINEGLIFPNTIQA